MKKGLTNHQKPSESGNSNYFNESANKIFAFFETLNPEQQLMIVQGSLNLCDCYQIICFEASLQSELNEKPINSRKTKI